MKNTFLSIVALVMSQFTFAQIAEATAVSPEPATTTPIIKSASDGTLIKNKEQALKTIEEKLVAKEEEVSNKVAAKAAEKVPVSKEAAKGKIDTASEAITAAAKGKDGKKCSKKSKKECKKAAAANEKS